VTRPYPAASVKVSGYHVVARIRAGRLELEGGTGQHRLHSDTSGLKELALVGRQGYISREALRWLEKAGASVQVHDRDGNLLQSHGSQAR